MEGRDVRLHKRDDRLHKFKYQFTYFAAKLFSTGVKAALETWRESPYATMKTEI